MTEEKESKFEALTFDDEIKSEWNTSQYWSKQLFTKPEIAVSTFACSKCGKIPKNPKTTTNFLVVCNKHSTNKDQSVPFLNAQLSKQLIYCPNMIKYNKDEANLEGGGIINTNNENKCIWKGCLRDINTHLKNCILMNNKIDPKNEIIKLKKYIKTLNNNMLFMREENTMLKTQLNEMQETLNNLSKKIDEKKNKIFSIMEKWSKNDLKSWINDNNCFSNNQKEVIINGINKNNIDGKILKNISNENEITNIKNCFNISMKLSKKLRHEIKKFVYNEYSNESKDNLFEQVYDSSLSSDNKYLFDTIQDSEDDSDSDDSDDSSENESNNDNNDENEEDVLARLIARNLAKKNRIKQERLEREKMEQDRLQKQNSSDGGWNWFSKKSKRDQIRDKYNL